MSGFSQQALGWVKESIQMSEKNFFKSVRSYERPRMDVKRQFHLILLAWFLSAFGIVGSLNGVALAEAGSGRPSQKPLRIGLRALQQIQSLREEKALRTPAQKKLDSQLIYSLKILRGDLLLSNVPMLRSSVEIASDGTVLVDIKGRVTAPLLGEIERLGGTVISRFEQYDAIRARLPLEQIEGLAEWPDIRFIGPAAKAVTNKVNTSEGDVAHNAALARSTFGVNGAGVKIGVLSDSVDYLATVRKSGDLPAVTVLQNAPGNSGEGTAMLEIIYDLAPGAGLYFATAWLSPASFADNILALRKAGCSVIVDDIIYFNESPFQDDIISQAVNTVTADGALYFSSAGNAGNLNDGTSGVWEGDFDGMVDSSLPGDLATLTVHDFGGGNPANQLTKDPPYVITLFWADPLGGSANDYDLYLLNPAGTEIWDSSTNVQDGNDDPYETVDSFLWYDKDNLLVIAKASGAADRFIYLSTNRGELEYATAGEIRGHAASKEAFAVAAVDGHGKTTAFDGSESVESFCSDGPRRAFYHQNGDPITPGNFSATGGEVRQKPDITAADGVVTATPGFDPFYGTSAAAPHGAAVAALLLSAEPSLTPEVVRAALTTTALDIEEAGWDRDSGAGIVMANATVSYLGILVRPFDPFRSYGCEDGPFHPSSKVYTLTNISDAPIDWEASKEQDWVTLSSDSGTLPAGDTATVTVSVNDNARTLGIGSYKDTIHFTNLTSGDEIATRGVNLLVRGLSPGVYLLLM